MRSILLWLLCCAAWADSSIKDYGAVGDGIAEDAGHIQAALDAAASGSTVTCPDGSYLISTPIYMRSGVTLSGGPGCSLRLNFSVGGSAENKIGVLFANGTRTTIYPDNPTVNALGDMYPPLIGLLPQSAGSATITCAVKGCWTASKAGDYLVIAVGLSPKWDTYRMYPQITKISEDTATLDRRLDFDISAKSPLYGPVSFGFFRIRPVVGAWLRGLTIVPNPGTSYPFGTSYAFRGGIDGVHITGMFQLNAYANSTDHFVVRRLTMDSGIFSGFNYSQYGLAELSTYKHVGSASCEAGQGEAHTIYRNNVITGATGRNLLFGFGGNARDVTFTENSVDVPHRENYALGILSGYGYTITNNVIVAKYGIKICGDCGRLGSVSLRGNRIFGSVRSLTDASVEGATLSNNQLNPPMGGRLAPAR